ncbi:MAG: carboxypeptidase-like regulatory domain-containing protein [Flavobacteriaceae bacterium]
MRSIYLLILFLITNMAVFAQEQRITVSFEDSPLEEVLQNIEETTGIKFYYVEDWLGRSRVSGTYNDLPLDEVLEDIFKDTLINFFLVEDGSVVLTRNNIIIDQLPEEYFGRSEEEITGPLEDEVNPLFVKEERAESLQEIETVRIGRQTRNNRRQRFTLSGQAINSETAKPIPELAIIVQGSNLGTSTDANGFYSLELPAGVNIIEARSLGIATTRKRVIIYNNGSLNFDLVESFTQLDEVVLSGETDRNVAAAVTGVTVLEVEKIKNIPLVLGERDILKAAVTLPGISTAGEGAQGYNVRGGRSDQNLFLLDKGVLYNPTHFFGIFSALNPFTTGDVSIYKGGIPAEFGGRLSSVFDINTKDATTEKFSGEVSIGPVTGNVMLEVPVVKGKSGLLVGGRATYSDWILNALDEPELNNSEASFYDVIGKYNHVLNENNELKATGYYSKDAFSITSDSLYRYSNRLISLEWDHRFNEKNTSVISLANSEYQFNIEFNGETNGNFDLNYKINETELKLKFKNLFSEAHTFDYGISGKYYSVEPGSVVPLDDASIVTPLQIPDEQGLEAGIFLSDSFKVSDKFLIDAGLRYSFYAALGEAEQRVYQPNVPRNAGTLIEVREFGNNEVIETYGGPEARFSARYFLMDDFSVKASFNNTYQYIHLLTNNTTASPTDTWKLSDLNIKPQEAYQVSLGLYKNFDGNDYELSLESYFKRSKNILDYKVGAQLLLNEALETEVIQGDGRAYGIEFLLKKNAGKLNGWLGYTYSRSFIRLDSEFPEERINNGEYFPSNFDKPHDVSVVANYKFTKRFSASANFVYQTGRPVTYPIGNFDFNNSQFVFYSDRNAFRIPDYYRLDISFNMEGNHKIKKFAHSFWNFSIYNVLGRNNPFSVFFVTENGELKAYQSSIFAIPIPTLTYNFKF